MTDAVDHGWPRDESSSTRSLTLLANAARAAGPPLLFGLRLWVSVCLALYVAFWLELDNAYWAGTSAALVCQPHLGASLRKGWFRMIGTLVGAVFIVVRTRHHDELQIVHDKRASPSSESGRVGVCRQVVVFVLFMRNLRKQQPRRA